jgi:hypothetical protein
LESIKTWDSFGEKKEKKTYFDLLTVTYKNAENDSRKNCQKWKLSFTQKCRKQKNSFSSKCQK